MTLVTFPFSESSDSELEDSAVSHYTETSSGHLFLLQYLIQLLNLMIIFGCTETRLSLSPLMYWLWAPLREMKNLYKM